MSKSNTKTQKALIVTAVLSLIILFVYIVVLRGGVISITSSGDYEIYQDVDQMVFGRTDIVRAVILDSRVEELNTLLPPRDGPNELYLSRRGDYYRLHTINRIRVVEVFKGNAQVGDIMEIAQMGGRQLFSVVNVSDILNFSRDDDVVLFMRTFYASHGIHTPASLLAGGQGVYRVRSSCGNRFEEGIITAYDENPQIASIELESFSTSSSVPLTVGDLMVIRYEAGLGPRPYNYQLPVDVDRSRLNESIARAAYYLYQYYMLPGWDRVQYLLDIAIDVRDNPFSRQIHVNPASRRLRHEMIILGIDTDAPVPGSPPTITGPTTLTLQEGYSATNVPDFIVTGNPPPTITLSDNQGGLITWSDGRLYIAEGIPVGTYTIVLTADTRLLYPDTHTFVLTVSPQAPTTTPEPSPYPTVTPEESPSPDATPVPTPIPGTTSRPTLTSPSPDSTPHPPTSPTPSPPSTPTPSPTPTPQQSPTPNNEPEQPQPLLRFEIGSLAYTHNGIPLISDAAPFIVENRAHIPLRIIAEALGAEVVWNSATRTGYMTRNGITISIVIDAPLPDGMGTPVIINNRTFVPARYISETFGAAVRWDRENGAVYIYPPTV